MPATHSVPVILISTLIGLLFGLMVWGFWRAKRREIDNILPGARDLVLLGLLALGSFSMGVFLMYALLYFSFF